MAQRVQRWIEVTPSPFTHEAEGLRLVRSLLPANAPFRAWSNFEFRDGHGKWHEVDLLVLGRRRLHLVELKYYSGTLRGDDLTLAAGRSPRRGLAAQARPAQGAAAGQQAAGRADPLGPGDGRGDPRPSHRRAVRAGVRLPAPPRPALPAAAAVPDGPVRPGRRRARSGLPGISERLLEPATPQQSVPANRDEIIAALMKRIGIVQRRQREAGSWVIDEEPLGEGDGWQDWPAFHRVATTDRGRIRFLVTPPGGGHDRAGQDPPGRRARVPDHVPAGERPAAAPAGHRRQRARRRPGVPGRRPVPAARPVAGRPRRVAFPRKRSCGCCGRSPRQWRTRTATGSCTAG